MNEICFINICWSYIFFSFLLLFIWTTKVNAQWIQNIIKWFIYRIIDHKFIYPWNWLILIPLRFMSKNINKTKVKWILILLPTKNVKFQTESLCVLILVLWGMILVECIVLFKSSSVKWIRANYLKKNPYFILNSCDLSILRYRLFRKKVVTVAFFLSHSSIISLIYISTYFAITLKITNIHT